MLDFSICPHVNITASHVHDFGLGGLSRFNVVA